MIAFDIETMKDESKIDLLPEPTADSRLKDPAKIEADKEKKREEQISKMALSPWFGTIASIAITSECRIVGRDGDEKEIVQQALDTLTTTPFCTYNGYNFDVPFLYIRAMILGCSVKRPLSVVSRKFSHDQHIDVMQELTGWGREKYLSMNEAAKRLLSKEKEDFDVLQIPQLLADKKYDTLESYNLKDTELTLELYDVCSRYLF